MNADQTQRLETILRRLLGVMARAELLERLHGPVLDRPAFHPERQCANRKVLVAGACKQQVKCVWFTLFGTLAVPDFQVVDEERIRWLIAFFKMNSEGGARGRNVPWYHHVQALLDVAQLQYEAAERVYHLVDSQGQ